MAASGLFYTVKAQSISVTNAAQNLFEFIAGSAVPFLLHAIRLEFVPTITSGVAQDVRAAIAIQTISTTGTGGAAVTPQPLNPRNTVAAVTTVNQLVTTPGTLGAVKGAYNPSVIVPFERIFTPDQRIPCPAGTRLAINLAAGLGGTVSMSAELLIEEI